MTTNVIMPQMGESIFEGTITKWLKRVGEKVNRDEPLFEISTDKVDSEIPSPAAGVVAEILVPEGKTVQINTVVAVIAAEGAEPAAKPAEMHAASLPPAPAEESAPPVPAPIVVAEPAKTVEALPQAPVPRPAPASIAGPAPEVRTSPLVRRLAREHGIELSSIKGTGLGGRVTKQDLLQVIEAAAAPAPVGIEAASAPPLSAAAVPAGTPSPAPEVPRFAGEFESVPMTTMRKSIAEHMVMSKRTSAHVNTIFEVDMTAVVRLRESHKAEFERREGAKLTLTPFIAKALVDTVRDFPVLNCSVAGENILYKKAVNVGIAVALDWGLIVPVIKDAHLKSFTGIVLAVNDLANRARTKKLRPEDVQNGTISITNPGIYGSLFGTPIINQPQVAILNVGSVEKRPVAVNDAIAIRSMAYLSLTFDHRVIDGSIADQAMAKLKERLQNWTQWVD